MGIMTCRSPIPRIEEQAVGPIKNQRVVVTEHGGPEVLQLVAEELPEP